MTTFAFVDGYYNVIIKIAPISLPNNIIIYSVVIAKLGGKSVRSRKNLHKFISAVFEVDVPILFI